MQRFLQLVEQHQRVQTPFLLMDRNLIRENARVFQVFSDRCPVFYAVKANSDPGVLECLGDLGIGFEISTEPELRIVRGQGIGVERIISSNPIKSPRFIKAMYSLGIRRFVFDSEAEAHKLAQHAPGSEVILRLSVDNSGSSWPLDDKFGVGVEHAVELLLLARTLGLASAGVTFHVGSQCVELDSWQKALELTSRLSQQVATAGIHLRVVNIGGGFPAHHDPTIPSVSAIFEYVFQQVDRLFPEDVELLTEPGRALVADAGVLVSTVIGKARRHDGDWLYLDLGVFNGLMEAVGNVHYSFWPTWSSMPAKEWTVAGPSCDSFDVIAHHVTLREPEVGERILVFPGGAYTTAYASTFNGSTIPKVVLA